MRNRQRVDLNRCTAARLSVVSGLAPDIAGRIVAYRRRRKRLASIRDVLDVRGVTEKDLEMLRLTTEVRQLVASPRATTKAAKPAQTTRSLAAPQPRVRRARASGRRANPATSKKGTQTLETGDSPRKRGPAASARKGKTKVLVPGKIKTAATRRSKERGTVKGSRRKSGGKRIQKSGKSRRGSGGLRLMTSTKGRTSPTTGLLICREAVRLKASQGLDYADTYGSPRPLLTVSGPSEGVQLARAEINNCALTVHLTERSPLMSPMVTVNIPSSLLERPGLAVFGEDKGALASPSSDARDASVPQQQEGVSVRSGPVTVEAQDRNNVDQARGGGGEVQKASPPKTWTEDQQEGYMAGSETDRTPPGFTPDQASPDVQTPMPPAVDNRGSLPASSPTGRRRKTRGHKKTAGERVQLWLEKSSCSSSDSNPERAGENRPPEGDSLVSGMALLPRRTPPADDQSEKAAGRSTIHAPRPGCKRDLKREPPATPAADGAAGRADRSVQTPPCSCRSCRRKRRAGRRSAEAAGQRRDRPGPGPDFTAATSPAQELSPAWCSLL